MKFVSFLLLFGSGFAGLGYQMVWGKTFAYGLGHEFPSILAVISAFMGGMAFGSFVLGERLKSTGKPLGWYGVLELTIGLWALVSIVLLPLANGMALRLIGLDPSPFRHWIVAFSLPFILLLPATAAMGATLPAMERFMSETMSDRSLALVYGVNTAGGVAGTLLTTFAIVPFLGFRHSLLCLAALNILCGLIASGLALRQNGGRARLRRAPSSSVPVDGSTKEATARRSLALPLVPGSRQEEISRPIAVRLAVTLVVTGLLGIGLEVMGVRILTQVFENTIYTFAAILAVYLFGTFAGALLYLRLNRRVDFDRQLCDLLGGVSFSCLAAIFALSLAPLTYSQCRASFGDSVFSMVSAEMATAASIFFLPTLFMGGVFTHLVQNERSSVGRKIGLNTIGAALAPLFFPIILMPAIGSKWTLVILSLAYLTLLPKWRGWRFAWIKIPALLLFVLPSNLHVLDLPPGAHVMAYQEGIMSSVAVLEDLNGQRTLRVDNHFQMGGTAAAEAEYRHAHIPLLLHPNPRKALFLGLGTGISFAAAGLYPNLQADGVELVPEVVGAMNSFEPYNSLATRNRNLKIHIADARRFIKSSTSQYDVIVADLFHPARDGAGALYSLEHFQAIRNHLAPEGLFCQWLPLHQLDHEVLGIIVKTFNSVFPNTEIYLLRYTAGAPVIGLVGFVTPPRFSTDWIEKRMSDPELQAALKKIALTDSIRFFGNLFGTDAMVQDLTEGMAPNTEDIPLVTFKAPAMAYRKEKSTYTTLVALLGYPPPETRELFRANTPAESVSFNQKLAAYMLARNTYLVGLIHEEQGELEKSVTLYIESAVMSPDFTTGYARCVSLAAAQAKTDPAKAKDLLKRLIDARPSQKIAREMLDRLDSAAK